MLEILEHLNNNSDISLAIKKTFLQVYLKLVLRGNSNLLNAYVEYIAYCFRAKKANGETVKVNWLRRPTSSQMSCKIHINNTSKIQTKLHLPCAHCLLNIPAINQLLLEVCTNYKLQNYKLSNE